MGTSLSLPTDSSDLETLYSTQNVLDVATRNNVRVSESSESGYVLHQFKDLVGNKNECTVEWTGQSNYAPKLSTVYLQIYAPAFSKWVTIDGDNLSREHTNFTLSAEILDLTDYKDANKMITCRIYQLT